MDKNYLSSSVLKHLIDDVAFVGPELILVAGAVLLIFLDMLLKDSKKAWEFSNLIFLIVVVGFAVVNLSYLSSCDCLFNQSSFFTDLHQNPITNLYTPSGGMLYFTKMSVFVKVLLGLCSVLLVMFNQFGFADLSTKERTPVYYLAVLSILLGSSLLTMSTHFLITLLAIELSSFGAYALIYFGNSRKSTEGSLKFVLYGLVATGVMLFGVSWVYATTGSVSYQGVLAYFNEQTSHSLMMFVGLLLVLGGFMFKLATVPFHIWVPDAFEGGSSSSLAYISLVPKMAVLANLIILFSTLYRIEFLGIDFQTVFLVLGALSLTVGNFFALGQSNVKRLLGFSSIAHSGFLLMAFGVMGSSGFNSLLFYANVYIFMNFGVFMLVQYLIQQTGTADITKWNGQGYRFTFVSVLLMVPILALIGLPPTAGFNAKLYVFTGLLELYQQTNANYVLVVLIIGVFNIIISLFYYLKLPFHLFFKKSETFGEGKMSVLTKLQLSMVVGPLILMFFMSERVIMVIDQVNYIVKYFIQ